MTRRSSFAGWASTLARLALLYAAAIVIGFLAFAASFKLGIVPGGGVLFFRGLVLAALSFAILFIILAGLLKSLNHHDLKVRDAFGGAILSLSFNVCFLVIAPVTVDRSVSIFILGEMAAHPKETYTAETMNALFVKIYAGEYQQIGRRLHEQAAIGNIEDVGGSYRISTRGSTFIAICKFVSWLFDGDPRFVSPPDGAESHPAPPPARP